MSLSVITKNPFRSKEQNSKIFPWKDIIRRIQTMWRKITYNSSQEVRAATNYIIQLVLFETANIQSRPSATGVPQKPH